MENLEKRLEMKLENFPLSVRALNGEIFQHCDT